jgi:cytochrome P450
MHRDPRYFDLPEEFRPERWDGDFAKRLPRFAYFPFGGGPRVCIGNSFAMMEAILLVATIAQRYELKLEPGFELQLFPSITLRPKKGIPMIVVRRRKRDAAGVGNSTDAHAEPPPVGSLTGPPVQ